MTQKAKHPRNALDALVPDLSGLREFHPALEFIRQHDDLIRQLASNPLLDSVRQHQNAMRQLTSNSVLERFRQQEEVTRRFLKDSIAEVHSEWTRKLAAIQISLDTSAFFALADQAGQIANSSAPWRDMTQRIATDFRNLIPEGAFSEIARLGESFRGAMPALSAFDAGIAPMDCDETIATALEQVRERAHRIVEDADATIADVDALFEAATTLAAAAPGDSRAATNNYVRLVLLWLVGTLAEDPVKAAARNLLATFLIFLNSLQPIALPTPPPLPAPAIPQPLPAADPSTALIVPGGWQIEGLPEIVKRAGPKASLRMLEFFTARIRNRNTRAAYANAVMRFFNWCDDRGLELDDITPFAIATYIEEFGKSASAPTVKQHLAAIRMLFDWLVIGQVLPMNPASSVRGPRHVVKRGKTPVLTAGQARQLLDSINIETIAGLRDRAIIGLMCYSFARVSAMVHMRVEDYYQSGKRWWVRLHEKGGKRHEVPAHHNAEAYVDAYLDRAGIRDEKTGPLFRSVDRRRALTLRPMARVDVLRMVKRRAAAASLPASTCCHTFRATGITAYLENGGTIENAQAIAAHESPRTTKLYDRTSDELTLDEIERIVI